MCVSDCVCKCASVFTIVSSRSLIHLSLCASEDESLSVYLVPLCVFLSGDLCVRQACAFPLYTYLL